MASRVEDIVIVGAGISGLATSLGLHRLGIRSLVLESADRLRTTGFALAMWANAWRALDALGVAAILRHKHIKLNGVVTTSVISGINISEVSFGAIDSSQDSTDHDVRCVIRKVLLETLADELPKDTIRFSSRVVHIETDGCLKSLHLADGTVLKTKVLIGCDGVNSMVAKYLGFRSPSLVGRSSIRGFVNFEEGHGFDPKTRLFVGKGVRFGVIPCDDYQLYWFFMFTPSPQEKERVEDPTKLKQVIYGKLGKVSDKIRQVFEKTGVENIVCTELRLRVPWDVVWGKISEDNVCVLGDALHPMTPDLAHGGCSALEDSVIIARLLGQAYQQMQEGTNYDWSIAIKEALERFAKERRWRSVDLITTSYVIGYMQQSEGVVMHFLRDKLLAKFLGAASFNKATFDCGALIPPP